MTRLASVFFFVLAFALCAEARPFAPAAPEPEDLDTESVTNVTISAAMAGARILRGSISLTATPSNSVEVAFGTTTNEVLHLGEESFCIGWRRGQWFMESPDETLLGEASDEAMPRTLSFDLRVDAAGVPLRWTLTTNDSSFTNAPALPPVWTFSRDWTALRLTIRGVDERNDDVRVVFDTDPAMLILR